MKKLKYLFLALIYLMFVLVTGCSGEVAPAKREAAPPKHKVILLGVDGLTEKVVNRLLRQKKLKNFQYLREHGSYGRIASIDPTASPALWTSMATGKKREEHGIINFEIPDQAGHNIAANSSHRKTKAIWNILSENNLQVGTIGYFTTWPVETVNGFMISDASIYPINKGFYPDYIQDIMKDVLAPYYNYDLNKLNEFAKISSAEQFKYFTPKLFKLLDKFGAELINDYQQLKNKQTYNNVRWKQYLEFFKSHRSVAEAIMDAAFVDHVRFEYAKKLYRNDLDFFALYLKGPDIVSHHNWGYYEPGSKTNPQDIRYYKDIIPNYYMFIDRVLGYFLQAADSDTIIILLSDHGFKKRQNALLFDLNKILNTMGYLDYGAEKQIKKDKIFDAKDYWWRDVRQRRLHVNLNHIYPNRNPAEDDLKLKQIASQLALIKVENTPLFEQIDFYPKKRSGLYLIKVDINKVFYKQSFSEGHPRLEESRIIINNRAYPLSRYFEYSLNEGQHATHDGVIKIMGPIIRPHNLIKGFSVLDVTPTVLRILNLPVGADMAGAVPTAIFTPEFLLTHPVRYIKSYDEINQPLKPTIPEKSPVDDKIKNQLRSLGYIQ